MIKDLKFGVFNYQIMRDCMVGSAHVFLFNFREQLVKILCLEVTLKKLEIWFEDSDQEDDEDGCRMG